MLEKRSKGQRRWGINAEFPLIDAKGITVIIDRRKLTDRRLQNTSFEDRLVGFAQMPLLDPRRKKKH